MKKKSEAVALFHKKPFFSLRSADIQKLIRLAAKTKNKCLAVIASMYQVYLFLEWVGILRGYVHNDLHSGNILYDDINNRIIIIDYGQNVFCYYF